MTDYYCDLDVPIFVDTNGEDHNNAYTGAAGLQAAIRGTGAATALAAGDTLYVKGSGACGLDRLVWLDCGKDVSGWSVGDVVRDNGGGSTWTGWIAETSYGANNDQILVWLLGLNEDDVVLADGIENVTAADTATLDDKDTKGIELDTASGASGSPITVEAQNASWETDGTKAVLDGNSKATNCLIVDDKDYWHWKNVEFKNAVEDNVTAKTDHARYWVFVNCEGHNAGGHGWGYSGGKSFSWSSFELCHAYNNGSRGIYVSSACRFVLCSAWANNVDGFNFSYGAAIGCVSYANGTYNYYGLSYANALFNCVSDDAGVAGMYFTGGCNLVLGCRITGTGTGILGDGSADVLDLFNFINCDPADSNITVDSMLRGVDTRTTEGVEGYIDGDNADLSLRNYGLTREAACRRIEVEL